MSHAEWTARKRLAQLRSRAAADEISDVEKLHGALDLRLYMAEEGIAPWDDDPADEDDPVRALVLQLQAAFHAGIEWAWDHPYQVITADADEAFVQFVAEQVKP
jgi:hypothetical protein